MVVRPNWHWVYNQAVLAEPIEERPEVGQVFRFGAAGPATQNPSAIGTSALHSSGRM